MKTDINLMRLIDILINSYDITSSCHLLGNCVGERNHRYFWLFLLVESVMLVWSVKIGW